MYYHNLMSQTFPCNSFRAVFYLFFSFFTVINLYLPLKGFSKYIAITKVYINIYIYIYIYIYLNLKPRKFEMCVD